MSAAEDKYSEYETSPIDADRRARQAAEYAFPYHHLPHMAPGRRPRLGRNMRGAMEYLAYLEEVIEVVRGFGPTSVLDVGCGDGRLLFDLVGHVDRLVGVDLDSRAIAHAGAFAPEVDFRTQGIEQVEGRFDVVTCVETLEHIPNDAEAAFFAAAAERVRPGGYLVVTVPSTARPVLAKHFRHYDVSKLGASVADLPGRWSVERLEEIVPYRAGLDLALRVLSNRLWTLDVPALNRVVLRMQRAPVARRSRGLHVLAVLRRCA